MVWYDVVVLAILAYTAWRGAQRGLVIQLAWITALVLCFKFSDKLAPAIKPHIGVGEPDSQVRHWIAMFILFVGFSIASFLVARMVESSLEKAKLKELDRFLGAVLGLLFGATIVLVGTFFAVIWEPTKASVLESGTGRFACRALDTIEPLTPEYFHEHLRTILARYQDELAPLHDDHGDLGEGSSDISDFLGGGSTSGSGTADSGSGQGGGFSLPDLIDGLAGAPGSAGSDSAGASDAVDGPTLDQLWRTLPQRMKDQFGTQIRERWNAATPQQRQNLVNSLARSFDFEMPAVVSDFLKSTGTGTGRQSSTTVRPDFAAMLNEIGDIYGDRDQIVRRTREHLTGIPPQVQEAVIRDWFADLSMQADPDPLTTVQTRLDERILRQLEKARVPLASLSYELRQRLNLSRQ
ncbi:MAG: CvpA family protein [Fuerstiella sp.]